MNHSTSSTRQILWQSADDTGLEHLLLEERTDGIIADGLIIGGSEGSLFRLRYRVALDDGWNVREAQLELLDGARVLLRSDGAGRWYDESGGAMEAFEGCREIDITATPFTNTLPIRRLNQAPGESAEIAVCYIDIPAMTLSRDTQRYMCVRRREGESLYRFEQPATGFTADILVDGDGLVVDYPGLFRRVVG